MDDTPNTTSDTAKERGRYSRRMNHRSSSWAAVIADEGLLRKVLTFVGPKQFRFVASVNRQWNRAYSETHNGDSTTCRKYVHSSRRALSILCREDECAELFRTGWWERPTVVRKCCDLGSLQWLWARHRKQPFCKSVAAGVVCYNAAFEGKLRILQWARANECEWNSRTCQGAAKGGHLDILKWARANGCDWNSGTCMAAAEGGHLDILKWAIANGCDWDSGTCQGAAK